MTNKQKLALAFVLLLAVFFRFYKIVEMPGGLFPDEAANGLDINLMQQGQLQPFYERGNGREALFFYMLWGSVELFGKGPWQHHIVSALIGVLSVAVTFFLTRRLFNDSGARSYSQRAVNIALLSSFLMAVSSWYVVLSRTAFRANLIPLFTAGTFYFILKAFQSQEFRQRMINSFLAGAVFALGFYSYIAYRIMVPILFMVLFWPLLAELKSKIGVKHLITRQAKPFLAALAGFVIFIYPLAHYFFTHPGSFVGRSGQVSVFNPELNQGNLLGAVAEVFRLSIAAYFTEGDLNWRHNISGFPFLSQIVSPFFAAGLLVSLFLAARYLVSPAKYRSGWKYFLLAGWFWGMLIPVITTAEGIPHGLRAIGTIPPVFIISAWVIYEFYHWLLAMHKRFFAHWHRRSDFGYKAGLAAIKALAAAFVAALVSQTYILYFVYAASSPENYYAFRSDLTAVSDYLIKHGSKDNTYLVLDKFSVQTTDYITTIDGRNPDSPKNRPYRQVDPEDAWKLSGLKKGDKIVFTQSSIFDIKKFKEHNPQARLVLEYRNKFGQAIMAVYVKE